MIKQIFYNVFIFGTIISICISPLLIFLYKNKYKYKLKNIYKIFIIILLLLILPINSIKFSDLKNLFKKQEIAQVSQNLVMPIETEVVLETTNTIIEVNDSINIKNNKLSNFSQFVPYLWISISSIFMLYNLITYGMYLYNSKKTYIEKIVPEIEEKINKICKDMNIKKIFYAFSDNITTPMVVGIFKKKIILPQNMLELEDYEMILMHEIIHIKNKDIECKLLLLLINSVYWFNPIIYKFIDQVEEVLELKCDEIVLENQPQIYKIKYAQVLLNQIEENRHSKYRFSLNFANKRRNIMKRFSNIVDKSKKKNMIGISCITASIIIIASAIVFSLPNINFAAIQEDVFENNTKLVVDDEVTLIKNTIDENTLVDEKEYIVVDKNGEKDKEITIKEEPFEVIISETDEESKDEVEIKLETNTKEENENSNNTDSEEKDVKYVGYAYKDYSTGEVGVVEPRNSEDEEATKLVVAAIPELIYPIENNYEISAQFYGPDNHSGVDFKAEEGTEIIAAASGTVLMSKYKGSYGNLVIIDHGNGTQTYYAHCSELFVSEGQTVNQGDKIAEVGATGNATGTCLHFELRTTKYHNPIDPIPHLKK